MEKLKACNRIIDFIETCVKSKSIFAFKPPEETRLRIEELIQREKTIGLSKDDKAELDLYMQLEHMIRLAKARARKSNNK